MKRGKKVEWTRLDNASKIFPATYNHIDTKVFRLACELFEDIDPQILQKALDTTIESFPFYRSVLRRGMFWYYFETSDLEPIVEKEHTPVCSAIYHQDKNNLLFRVSYYHKRMNLEVFHALSDGAGALWFFQTLVHHYLLLKHKKDLMNTSPALEYKTSISKKMDDSFERYFIGENLFTGKKPVKKKKSPSRVYGIHGSRTEENRMNVIEGSMSVKTLLKKVHEYHTTLTIFITALLIYSIYQEMSAKEKNHPVVLSIPINLRQFFHSETARNFFSTMEIGYDFGKNSSNFSAVIQGVKEGFQRELTEEELNTKLNRLISLEKNPLIRILPLPMKNMVLRLANKQKDRGITTALSNIGSIPMPPEFKPYIRQFSLCTSARRPQACLCSYGDRLVVSFTSPFRETEIQRRFFQFLSTEGIDIEIASNLY